MDRPFHGHREAGMQIILKRIRGVTKPGILKRPFHFQISPLDEFGTDHAGNWNDYVTINGGTFTRDGSRGLDTLQFRSMAVDYNPTWAVKAGGRRHDNTRRAVPPPSKPLGKKALRRYKRRQRRAGHLEHVTEIGFNKPHLHRETGAIKRLEASLTPFLLIAWNKGLYDHPDIRMKVTLRSLSVREMAGEPDARYYDMSFTEWRRPKLSRQGYTGDPRAKDLPAVVALKSDGIARTMEAGLTWVDGEGTKRGQDAKSHHIGSKKNPATLRKLAKYFYGQPSLWKHIAAKNGWTKIGGERDLSEHLERRLKKHKIVYIKIPKIDFEKKAKRAKRRAEKRRKEDEDD